MIYRWKDGFRANVNAQVAGERLESIRKSTGALTVRAVVDDARHKSSPLHKVFDWNDKSAAEKWRQEQAGALIRHIVVVTQDDETDDETQTRAFVVVQRGDEQSYEAIRVAMSNDELRAQVLARALADLESWRERYEGYKELADVYRAIDKTKNRVKRPRKASQDRAAARIGEAATV